MDRIQWFIWAAAATGVGVALLGFLLVDPGSQIPTQFDLNGWTTTHARNVSLLIFAGGHLLAAGVLSAIMSEIALPWLRWLAVSLMAVLPTVSLLAVLHAA